MFSAHVDQVRANFKVAFLNEFRKDARGALTAYIKAYEQLLKESDLIDVVERMDLCNHITVRPEVYRIPIDDIAEAYLIILNHQTSSL